MQEEESDAVTVRAYEHRGVSSRNRVRQKSGAREGLGGSEEWAGTAVL